MNSVKVKNYLSVIESIDELIEVFPNLNNHDIYTEDIVYALKSINSKLENESGKFEKSIKIINHILLNLNPSYILEKTLLQDELLLLINQIKEDTVSKPTIVFLPYKFSMWDSLEPVYRKFEKSGEFNVKIIPIPYYDLTRNELVLIDESEKYLKSGVEINHYSQIDLNDVSPEIIFVHNIYDSNNLLTQVPSEFHTKSLSDTGAKIVYIPYYLSSFVPFSDKKSFYPYALPSIKYVDDFIVLNDYEKNIGIKEGITEGKITALGSPKIDYILNQKKIYSDVIKGNTNEENEINILLDTECMYFANDPIKALISLIDCLNIPKYSSNCNVVWREHPYTKSSILKFQPNFVHVYENLINDIKRGKYPRVEIDKNNSYINALLESDVYVGQNHSLLNLSINLNKKIVLLNERLDANSLLPDNGFIFAENNFYEIIKKGKMKGKSNLLDLANELDIYLNNNGDCSDKIFEFINYKYINNLKDLIR